MLCGLGATFMTMPAALTQKDTGKIAWDRMMDTVREVPDDQVHRFEDVGAQQIQVLETVGRFVIPDAFPHDADAVGLV
jgi:hypothetical protein